MSLAAAECPNCGAKIQIENTMEKGYCFKCGQEIDVEEAISQYVPVANEQETLTKLSSVPQDIENGNKALAANEWENAYRVFYNAAAKQIYNYEIWFGLLRAMTSDFTWADRKWVRTSGTRGMDSAIKNSLKCADENQVAELKTKLREFLESQRRMDAKIITKERRKKVAGIVCLIGAILLLIAGAIIYLTVFEAFDREIKFIPAVILAIGAATGFAGLYYHFISHSRQTVFFEKISRTINRNL